MKASLFEIFFHFQRFGKIGVRAFEVRIFCLFRAFDVGLNKLL